MAFLSASKQILHTEYCNKQETLILHLILTYDECASIQPPKRKIFNCILIITGSKNRDSCRDLFKNLKILPLHSQYIPSLLLFVADNKSMYNLNTDIHNIDTRQKLNFHQHSAKCSIASL
jgi:hypothetical protein